MTDQNMDHDRKWQDRGSENDDQERYYGDFRYTPYTTDLRFFSDASNYEVKNVERSTQYTETDPELSNRPRGNRRPDEHLKEEINNLLMSHGQVDTSGIRVEVQDGIVTLSGAVNSPDESQMAQGIARNVIGVLEVNNRLKSERQAQGNRLD